MASLDQKRESLDPSWTVSEALTGGRGDTVTIGGQTRHVTAYMKDFLFQAEQARTPLNVLSGGERGRLMLARALAKPSNLLVLDEPTNDLDMETLDVLEEMLGNYAGTVILISHDRDFLDRVVSSVDRAGRRRALDRVCRRIFRHAGAAQGRTVASRKPAVREPAREKTTAPAQPKAAKRKLCVSREACAGDAAGVRSRACRRKCGNCRRNWRIPISTHGIARRSRSATNALTQAQAQLATAEERWLELEILREEMGE